MKKKMLSAFLALCLVFGSASALPENTFTESTSITASAEASTATSGKCGDNVSWSLKNGVLTISGKGKMTDYYNGVTNPFRERTDIKSVIIKSGVTSIGYEAFSRCKSLKSVTIPNSVTSIGDRAFSGCKNLTSVTIPSSVNSIGEGAFSGSSLTSVTIPSSVKIIGLAVFSGCTSLKSVTIPSSVKSIGDYTFYHCTSLTSVTIPSSVTSIGEYAFGFYENYGPKKYENYGPKKVDGFTIYGYKYTSAEKYAKKNGFKFVVRSTIRYAGSDRAETATKISKAVNAKTSDTVILATGFDFHDALAAVPLASAYNAPLLLADRDNLSAKTLAEIKRLKAKNVIVVASTNSKDQNGNDAAIRNKVYKQLSGYNVTKLVGSSYYETAKKVAQQLQKKTKKAPKYVFFTTDKNYADALSVSPVAAILKAPIFYVDPKGKLNANTTYYLKSVKSSVKKVFIVGGTNAVSKDVVTKIKAVLPGKTVQRFAGADRYDTCLRINNAFSGTLTGLSVCVAKGYNFPDALAGGVFAAKMRSPLLLADNSIDSRQTKYLKSKKTLNIYVFGGTKAVPASLVNTISKACK